jgi:hypothetical protein
MSRFFVPRNSFAGLVASNHCLNKQGFELQAFGNGSMNDPWLSQTGDAQKIATSRTHSGLKCECAEPLDRGMQKAGALRWFI